MKTFRKPLDTTGVHGRVSRVCGTRPDRVERFSFALTRIVSHTVSLVRRGTGIIRETLYGKRVAGVVKLVNTGDLKRPEPRQDPNNSRHFDASLTEIVSEFVTVWSVAR